MAGPIRDPQITQQQTKDDGIDLMDVADFLFGVRSIERILKGEGSWGDLITVGVTAATFLIPPAKIATLSKGALGKVFKETIKVQANTNLPPAAINAVTKTQDNLTYEYLKRIGRDPDTLSPEEFAKVKEKLLIREDLYTRTTPTKAKIAELKGEGTKDAPEGFAKRPTFTDVFGKPEPESYAKQQRVPVLESGTKRTIDSRLAVERPDYTSEQILKDVERLNKLKSKMSPAAFAQERARILLSLFPEQELVPMIKAAKTLDDEVTVVKSTNDIIQRNKKKLIKELEKSDDDADYFLAQELKDLDYKTLKQELTIINKKIVNVKEISSETATARSAIQPEIDQMLYDKEALQNLLTGERDQEATTKLIEILTRWVDETTDETLKLNYQKSINDIRQNGLTSNVVKRIQDDIKKLNKRIETYEGYLANPFTDAAYAQTEKMIASRRPGRETVEYLKPSSYRAKESIRKPKEAPSAPQRATLQELKNDEDSLIALIGKETNPTKRQNLRKELDSTRKEIKLRESREVKTIQDAIEKGPLAQTKKPQMTKELAGAQKEIDKLEQEIIDLRAEYTSIKEPKQLPDKSIMSVDEQRKLITRQAKAKRKQIDKLKKRLPLSETKSTVNKVDDVGKVVRAKDNVPGAVYIGRGSGEKGKFGNPFPVGNGVTVKEAVDKYRKWLYEKLKSDPEYAKDIYSLKGKTLACPGSEPNDACHGTVILKAIKWLEDNPQFMESKLSSKLPETKLVSKVDDITPINSFRGENSFLSNMADSPVTLGGVKYPTVEHAFQAAKTTVASEREAILKAKTAADAKRIGRNVTLRKDWNSIRETVMEKAVREKFKQNPELAKKLINTGEKELIEGNTWGDTFWGVANGKGQNKLGKILMKIRKELMEGK